MVHKTAQNPSSIENTLDFSLSSIQNQTLTASQSSFQPNPQASDFSTMQLLFQTNSAGQNNFSGLNQIQPLNLIQQPQGLSGFNFGNSTTNPPVNNDQ